MPSYPGFVGPSYLSQSPVADCEMLMNFYVELLETPYGRSRSALYPTPGLTPFVGFDQGVVDVGCRAGFEMNGRSFAVMGQGFYELFANNSIIKRGTVAANDQLATISSNGVLGQLLITSGGNAYAYDLNTNVLTQIAALNGLATMGGVVDGYGLVFNGNATIVYVSAVGDVSNYTIGTNFFQRSIAPDPWRAMVIRRSEIILVGEYTGEVWRDVNAGIGQPFAPDLGAVFNAGTSAPWSVKVSDELVVWVKNTPAGDGTIVAMRGYVPEKISNYGVDTAVAGYRRDMALADAETLIYQDIGHTFANVRFPRGNATWTWDTTSTYWHQRGYWNAPQARFDLWRPRVHWTAFGRNLVGTADSSTIFELDNDVTTEADGTSTRRVRVAPPLYATDGQRLWCDRLGVELQTGVGTQSGQGQHPQAMLRISNDYGQTWGPQRMRNVGEVGKYGQKVYWLRNGSSLSSWVPELSVSDPVPWRVVDADVLGRNIANLRRAA